LIAARIPVIAEDEQLHALAAEQQVEVEALRALLEALRARSGADHFYVFWTSGGAERRGPRRERLILAFLTPDAALAFAQRNRLVGAVPVRLRRLSLIQLVRAVLRTPAIVAIVFVGEPEVPMPAGQFPQGVRVERTDLIRQLHTSARS
jgi:hypothetical protein